MGGERPFNQTFNGRLSVFDGSTHIAAQQLPDINVGDDYECIQKIALCLAHGANCSAVTLR
jgi:hypothetical protein